MYLEQYIQNPYLRAFIIVIALFIVLKILSLIIEKIIKLTAKTKTEFDDIIINRSRRPVTFVILALGLRLAVEELQLAQNIAQITEKVLTTIVILTLAYLISSIINILISRWGTIWASKTKSKLDDNLIILAQKFVNIIAIILVFLYILNYWGIQVGPLLASLGIAGIAVAFALQNTLSNIFGGVSLILDKTVKVGDLVYIDKDTKGTIVDIGIRSTKIRTFDNELIIMPNGKLADMKIQNIVLPEPKARVVIPFSVAYGSKVDFVKKVVLDEIKKIQGVSEEPEPLVRFVEMGDSALLFKAYFYMDDYKERFRAIDEANTLIYNALNKHRISIPFPQMDVHIKR